MNKPDSRACRKGAMSEPQLARGTCKVVQMHQDRTYSAVLESR